MATAEFLIVAVAAVVITAIAALAMVRMRDADLAANECRATAEAAERAEVRAAEAADAARRRREEAADATARLAARAVGPEDGRMVGVHVGPNIVRGTRVLRDAPEAEGWIVLEAGAELLEGERSIKPLGGRQWLPATQWMQEL